MKQLNYEVEVLVDSLPLYEYLYNGLVYLECRKFVLRIRNNSSCRVLAIPTIDGLSMIDGKLGSFDSPGYLLSPLSSVVIDEWKRVDSDPPDSEIDNAKLGIIGVAIFRESSFTPSYPVSVPDSTLNIPSTIQNSQEICTNGNKNGWSNDISFKREKYPDSVFRFFYNSRSALKRIGINCFLQNVPDAFPGKASSKES